MKLVLINHTACRGWGQHVLQKKLSLGQCYNSRTILHKLHSVHGAFGSQHQDLPEDWNEIAELVKKQETTFFASSKLSNLVIVITFSAA